MALLTKLFTNCACPKGRMGRAMLKFMNLCHAPLTNWGKDLLFDHGCGAPGRVRESAGI